MSKYTTEQVDALFTALAQGVVNISEGHTTIEEGSRIHRAMSALVDLHVTGQLTHGKPKLVQDAGTDLVTVKPATTVEAGEPIPEERCNGCKLRASMCDVPNTIEDHPLGRACFACRDTEDLIGKITPMLIAAPSRQLNQTSIARRLARKPLTLNRALYAMSRRNIIERAYSNAHERPSAVTYRLTESVIAAHPRYETK